MDVTGKWFGVLTYGKEYKQFAGKELFFEMELVQYGNECSGFAMDTGGSIMNPDPAHILGTVEDKRIYFVKHYESIHYPDHEGNTIVDRTRTGPAITYTGVYNNTSQTFSGSWKIKKRFRVLWIIHFTLSSTGTWTMQKKGNQALTEN